mmetsp:Transcript_3816/g.5765  ORF Transcript_3816/g.5765 Transcript_3816/m.5765 type:complete len:177 (-) Transcript_3816:636-1166(-)
MSRMSISSRGSFNDGSSFHSRGRDNTLLTSQQILSASCLEINSILLKNKEEEIEEEKVPDEPNKAFYAVDPISEQDEENSVSFMVGEALFKEKGLDPKEYKIPSIEIPSQKNPSNSRKTPILCSRGLSFPSKRFPRIMSIKQQREEEEHEKHDESDVSNKCAFLSCSSQRQSPLPR